MRTWYRVTRSNVIEPIAVVRSTADCIYLPRSGGRPLRAAKVSHHVMHFPSWAQAHQALADRQAGVLFHQRNWLEAAQADMDRIGRMVDPAVAADQAVDGKQITFSRHSTPATQRSGLPGLRARARAATNIVLGAAHVWWANHRPLSHTLQQHLENPTINTCSPAEAELARAVAGWITAATVPGTHPDMPIEARRDAAGKVLGYTRARTPLEAAVMRRGLSVPELARQLDLPRRALNRWVAGTNQPRGVYRERLQVWMTEQQAAGVCQAQTRAHQAKPETDDPAQ